MSKYRIHFDLVGKQLTTHVFSNQNAIFLGFIIIFKRFFIINNCKKTPHIARLNKRKTYLINQLFHP